MDNSTVEDALEISPEISYSVSWNNDYTVLTIDFLTDLDLYIKYIITIGAAAMGTNGGLLENTPYTLSFTTGIPNTRPVLTQGKITPTSGDTETTFTFSVHYYDADGDPPDSITVLIDGDEHDMNLVDSNASDGTYEYKTKLAEGSHTYYFSASDGTDAAISDDNTPVNAATASTTGNIEKAEEDEDDWSLYVILIVIIIIIIAILAIVLTHRKPSGEDLLISEEEDEIAEDMASEEDLDDKEGLDEDEESDEDEYEEIETFECPTCGAELTDDDTECPECGEQFDDED
jgi:hypothetical protein